MKKYAIISISSYAVFEAVSLFIYFICVTCIGDDARQSYSTIAWTLRLISLVVASGGIAANLLKNRTIPSYPLLASIGEVIAILFCAVFASELSSGIFGNNRIAYIIMVYSRMILISLIVCSILSVLIGVSVKKHKPIIISAIVIAIGLFSAFLTFIFTLGMFGLPSAWELAVMPLGIIQPFAVLLPTFLIAKRGHEGQRTQTYSHLEEYKRRMRK